MIVFSFLTGLLVGSFSGPSTEVIAEGPEEVLIYSNAIENNPFSPPINFTEDTDYIRLDNGLTYVVAFYKGTYGYNTIYYQNGSVLVYNERMFLEYWSGSQWKQRGVPVDLTWVQVTDTWFNVTRHYDDYIGTTYNVTFIVRTGEAIKTVFSMESGQADDYNFVWDLNGITQEAYTNYENRTIFGDNETDTWIGFDWEDVYVSLGDIATTSIDDVAEGKKLEVRFNIGTVNEGQTLVLDPDLIDSFSESNEDGYDAIRTLHPSATGYHSAVGQSFMPDAGYILTSAKFYLKKYGTWGLVEGHAFLYAHTGTFGSGGEPTGSTLAESDSIRLDSVLTVNYQLIEFSFTGGDQYSLQKDTAYCITAIIDVGTLGATKQMRVGRDSGGGHEGNGHTYDGNWDGETYDVIFYVYGTLSNVDPVNDACDSDATFDVGVDGWVNVTVTDTDGGYDKLDTVDMKVTTASSETFTLRWTESTDAFTETVDASGVCTLDATDSTRTNTDSDTDVYRFNFQINAAPLKGVCSVQVTTTDDAAATDVDTYSAEFSINFYLGITVNDGSHSWASMNPGTTDQALGDDEDIDVTIDANANFDLEAKGDGALASGGDTIALSNVEMHETTLGSAIALTTSYQDIPDLTDETRGTSQAKAFKLWISIPNPQQDGTYTYTLSVKGTEH